MFKNVSVDRRKGASDRRLNHRRERSDRRRANESKQERGFSRNKTQSDQSPSFNAEHPGATRHTFMRRASTLNGSRR